MGFIHEFKKFAVQGNVMDMAVGVIIGGAFGKIVGSLVDDVIMPPIGKLLGGVDFSQKFVSLGDTQYPTLAAAKAAGAATLNYGSFIQAVIQFLIIAMAVFMMVKVLNAAKAKEEAAPVAPPPPSEDVLLLREIRDALKR